jgi:hypothetical protein
VDGVAGQRQQIDAVPFEGRCASSWASRRRSRRATHPPGLTSMRLNSISTSRAAPDGTTRRSHDGVSGVRSL